MTLIMPNAKPANPDASPETTGIVLVDHGSRRDESNRLLLDVVEAFRKRTTWRIIEPAHMELAEPSIATAFERCVQRGATLVVVFPYLLSPGRHWEQDIPRLAAEAAAAFPGVKHLVTSPLGLHPAILGVIDERIDEGLRGIGLTGGSADAGVGGPNRGG